jgi:hypothetical protein
MKRSNRSSSRAAPYPTAGATHALLTNAAPIAGYPDPGGAIAVLKTTE